jgi:hypothetical protein
MGSRAGADLRAGRVQKAAQAVYGREVGIGSVSRDGVGRRLLFWRRDSMWWIALAVRHVAGDGRRRPSGSGEDEGQGACQMADSRDSRRDIPVRADQRGVLDGEGRGLGWSEE